MLRRTTVPRTAFVTGGTGFVGRHIVEQLVAAGWRVVALHRPTSDVRALQALGAELAVGSITDAPSLARAVPEDCDAVFHVAANTSLWSGGNALQTLENVDGTRHVVQAAIAARAKRFVHTSSVSAWGHQHIIPFDENAPSNALASPINYERTKYLGELEVEKGIARGLSAVILNPGHIVGRYDVHGWSRMITLVHAKKLPGIPPGQGVWAHADEVARAHLAAVDRGGSGERYLLGGTVASYVEMVRIIGELTGRKVPSEPIKPWLLQTLAVVSQWGSYVTRRAPTVTPEIAEATRRPPHLFRSDKAMRVLDYRAVPLETMLRECIEWMQKEGLLA
jgi:nucleoside-diphosphate-sugar epimerase